MGKPKKKYQRKTSRGKYGDQKLEQALLFVKNGGSLKNASKTFGIDRRVLRRHRDGRVRKPGKVQLGSFIPVLPSEFEAELVSHILDMQV